MSKELIFNLMIKQSWLSNQKWQLWFINHIEPKGLFLIELVIHVCYMTQLNIILTKFKLELILYFSFRTPYWILPNNEPNEWLQPIFIGIFKISTKFCLRNHLKLFWKWKKMLRIPYPTHSLWSSSSFWTTFLDLLWP